MSEQMILPAVPDQIPHGDMPGDKIQIGDDHIRKAQTIYPLLREELARLDGQKAVVAVCGGSGVGKSEIASVLAYYLNHDGIGAYVMSGDNYPRRIPRDNDIERERVYRQGGLHGLVDHDLLTPEITAILRRLWEEEKDADLATAQALPWLAVYQQSGRRALAGYLGTPNETNFDEVTDILARFHQGEAAIYLKRMGRETTELWYDKVDFSKTQVLIVEWTHGNSDFIEGVDIPILLNSTPAETLAHRRARNRDGKTDSAFTTMVLEIEQKKLEAQAHKARIILSKQGQLLSYADYRLLMAKEEGGIA
ncbi:MAG: adenylylsulfate kinase [Clostridia bacterium]|nr:adenylylsulfate kinase [Clostridia bacterium]